MLVKKQVFLNCGFKFVIKNIRRTEIFAELILHPRFHQFLILIAEKWELILYELGSVMKMP